MRPEAAAIPSPVTRRSPGFFLPLRAEEATWGRAGLHGQKQAENGRKEGEESRDGGRNPAYRERFDFCVSRAVANLSTLSEYCLPFVKVGGYFVPYKSGMAGEEAKEAQKALQLLGGKEEKSVSFCLPGTDMERTLFLIRKTAPCPKKYPRKAGLPGKEPLGR